MARRIVKETIATDDDERVVATDDVPAVIVAVRVIYYVFGVIAVLLALRVLLLLLAANQGNGFVDFIYGLAGFFAAPFYGIFNYEPSYGQSTFEISSVVAIIVYLLIAMGLAKLVTLGSRHQP